jgi:hypothetical protein
VRDAGPGTITSRCQPLRPRQASRSSARPSSWLVANELGRIAGPCRAADYSPFWLIRPASRANQPHGRDGCSVGMAAVRR